jgi:hypothetical protein
MKVQAMPMIRPGITTTPYPFMGMPQPEGLRLGPPSFKGKRKNMYTPSIYSIEAGITAVRTPKTKMFSGAEFRPLITRIKTRRR